MSVQNRSERTDRTVFRPLILLALTVFIDLLCFGIVLPNLPRYTEMAAGTNHQSSALIGGLLAASYSFTQFLFAPMWGRVSDRVGRRPIILLSLIGIAFSYTLFGFAGTRLWMLFAARLLAGLLSSASIGVAFAYVADVTTPENRAKGIGLLGACFGLGFLLGPTLGGLMAPALTFFFGPGDYISVPAFVAAGLALMNFLFSIRFLPESLSAEERAKRYQKSEGYNLRLLLRVVNSPVGFLFLLTFIVTFGFSALEQSFGFYLLATPVLRVSPEAQPRVFGLILGLAGLVGVVIQGGLIGRFVGRYGEGNVARAGLMLMILGFATLPLARNLWVLALGPMLVLSAGRSMIAPSLSTLISRKAKMGQGLTLSTQQSFDALARTVGPVTSGALFRFIGPPAPFLVASVVMAGALLLAYHKRDEMNTTQQPKGTGFLGEGDPLPEAS